MYKRQGKQLGPKTGDVTEFTTYEEVFEAYKKQIAYFLDIKIKGSNVIEKIYAEHMPVPFLSVITNDCISKGKDYNSGGARYNTKYIQGVGIGTITDCLAAVKYNVFDEKKFTMAELLEALEDNFEAVSYTHLFDQLQIFQHHRACFLIGDIEDFLFNERVADCLCFWRSVVHEIFFQRHQCVRVAAVLDLSAFTQGHETISGSSFTVARSAKAGNIAHLHQPTDDFIECSCICLLYTSRCV